MKKTNVKLSERQKEVLLLCAKFPDRPSSELAKKMGVSNSTFRSLLASIYAELDTNSREVAVTRAIKLDLISITSLSSSYGVPRMAGDSTTDAPLPNISKKKKEKK